MHAIQQKLEVSLLRNPRVREHTLTVTVSGGMLPSNCCLFPMVNQNLAG